MDRLTPGTEAYFAADSPNPFPEQDKEQNSDKILKMKVTQEELRKNCSKETLNVALDMNARGDIFIVEDSFVQKENVLNYKIRSEKFVDPSIPEYSKTKLVKYPVTIRFIEARTERVQKWEHMTACHCGCPWHEQIKPKYCKHIFYLLLRNFM